MGSGPSSEPAKPTSPPPATQVTQTGSLVNMQKQDPSVEEMQYAQMWLPGGVRLDAPAQDIVEIAELAPDAPLLQTDDVIAAGFGTVPPGDSSNNFLYSMDTMPGMGTSCMAAVETVLTMYRRALKRMGIQKTLNWQSGQPILVLPAEPAANQYFAFYLRAVDIPELGLSRNMIACGIFEDPEDSSSFTATGASFDVVAHETGHAILDGLRPDWYEGKQVNPQTKGFDEAFGDITVLLAQLNQLDVCERAVVAAKGDLHKKTFFVKLAEEVAERFLQQDSLRNADNDLRIDEVTNEEHDLSQVFVGAFYDILVDIYDLKTDLTKYNPAVVLHETGQHLMEIVLRSMLDQTSTQPMLADMAKGMMNAETNADFKAIMKKQFDRRKLFDPSAKPKPAPAEGQTSASLKKRAVECGGKNAIASLSAVVRRRGREHVIIRKI